MGKGGSGGGEWPPPKGKGVSLSRSIELDFESAEKDEFVSYAGK